MHRLTHVWVTNSPDWPIILGMCGQRRRLLPVCPPDESRSPWTKQSSIRQHIDRPINQFFHKLQHSTAMLNTVEQCWTCNGRVLKRNRTYGQFLLADTGFWWGFECLGNRPFSKCNPGSNKPSILLQPAYLGQVRFHLGPLAQDVKNNQIFSRRDQMMGPASTGCQLGTPRLHPPMPIDAYSFIQGTRKAWSAIVQTPAAKGAAKAPIVG